MHIYQYKCNHSGFKSPGFQDKKVLHCYDCVLFFKGAFLRHARTSYYVETWHVNTVCSEEEKQFVNHRHVDRSVPVGVFYRTTWQFYAPGYKPSVFPVSKGFSSLVKGKLAFPGLLYVETVESSCRRVAIYLSGYGMFVCHRLNSYLSILFCTHLSPLLFISTVMTCFCGTQLVCLVCGHRDGRGRCL